MALKLTGRVACGRGIGRRLGYATANLVVKGALAAARDGVYAAWVMRAAEGAGRRYGAMANLGVRPTFDDGGGRTLEVHLFDFKGDLYGERLTVELVDFIRPERKFSSTDDLAAQIAKDAPAARRALKQAARFAACTAAPAPTAKKRTPKSVEKHTEKRTEKRAEERVSLAFERITDTDHPFFKEAWNLYLRSFPPEERRQLRTQRKIMADAPYHFELIVDRTERANGNKNGGALVGILLWWEFDDMRYLEHFATMPRVRGGGLGARTLAAFTARSAVPVVLEVELPETELSRRRVGFYRRQGFVASERPYTHPPYKRGGERVPLMLMSHPAPVTDAQFDSFVNVHHPVIHRFAM